MVKYSDISALQYNRMEPIRLLTGHSPLVFTLKLQEWTPVRAYRYRYTIYIAPFPEVVYNMHGFIPSSGQGPFFPDAIPDRVLVVLEWLHMAFGR